MYHGTKSLETNFQIYRPLFKTKPNFKYHCRHAWNGQFPPKWPCRKWPKSKTRTDFSASNHQGGHQQLSRWVRTKSFLPNTKCFFKDIKYGPWSTWPTLSRCFLSPLLCQINLELAQITLVLFLIYLQTYTQSLAKAPVLEKYKIWVYQRQLWTMPLGV